MIVTALGIIAIFGLGFGIGVAVGKNKKSLPKPKKKEPHILRKGVVDITIRWRPNDWTDYRDTTVLVVLHELERIVDQSRVIIAHVDDAPNQFVRDCAIKRIGSYIETDAVRWDEPIKRPKDVHEELTEYLERLENETKHGFNHQDDLEKVTE